MKTSILILLLALPLCLAGQTAPKNNPLPENECDCKKKRKPQAFFTEQGQVYILPALGLMPTYWADKAETDMPPIQVGIRWMTTKNFSLGAYAGYSRSWSGERQVCGNIRASWFNRSYFIGIEKGFHYTEAPNWDLYGSMSLLFQFIEVEPGNPEAEKAIADGCFRAPKDKMTMTAHIGARYALSSRYSVFGELGYGVSLLKVGVGYRVI